MELKKQYGKKRTELLIFKIENAIIKSYISVFYRGDSYV